jgi:hypothetical protein
MSAPLASRNLRKRANINVRHAASPLCASETCFCFMSRRLVHHKSMLLRKVKCTLVQALGLCIGRTAHKGSRGIALLFHDHGTRREWGVRVTLRPLFTPGKDPVPIVQEAGWAPGPVWTGAENLAPPGFDPQTVQPVASHVARCKIAINSNNVFISTSFLFCIVSSLAVFYISLCFYMSLHPVSLSLFRIVRLSPFLSFFPLFFTSVV